jgi:hypothetical protein
MAGVVRAMSQANALLFTIFMVKQTGRWTKPGSVVKQTGRCHSFKLRRKNPKAGAMAPGFPEKRAVRTGYTKHGPSLGGKAIFRNVSRCF